MKITYDDITALAPKARPSIVGPLIAAFPDVLPRYGITTPLRFAHFIAQAAHETMGLRTLEELGGDAYFNKRYGPQTAVGKRLGNTQDGDGARFHGRGIFQLTGRDNYRTYGKRLGIDLVNNPARAADPAISLRVACEYWQAKDLNRLADADDVVEITRRINGGRNGLADRKAYLKKAKALWNGIGAPVLPPAALPEPDILPDAPIATGPDPSALTSGTVISAGGALAGSGALGFLSFIQSPWAFAAFAVVAVLIGVIAWRWLVKNGHL